MATPKPVSLLEGSCLKVAAVPLQLEVLKTLDTLYAFYHRQWWCYIHMYRVFKYRQALLNALALLVVAAALIAGSICENSIVVSSLAAGATVIKGWNDFKKFPIKVDRCQFAYTTYAKTLTELRTYLRGIPFKEDIFLIKMQTFDDTITEFSLAISDRCTQTYHRLFQYVSVDGMCFAHGCPRQPILNASHISLKEDIVCLMMLHVVVKNVSTNTQHTEKVIKGSVL